MTYLMGIDGGGSNLRIVITDLNLMVCAECRAGTVNPSVIGQKETSKIIQETMREAMQQVGLSAVDIAAVGIGIAGASANHSKDWLIEVVSGVLPNSIISPSSDIEIALVGAHGKRQGILILAGTGSVAFGVNAEGKSVQAGGWGYLIGDEGSGFWVGREGLRAVAQAEDSRGESTILSEMIFDKLALKQSTELIQWLYGLDKPPVKLIAGLARVVLEAAEADDSVARKIIDRAAQYLADYGVAVQKQLDMHHENIAFAGGLLETQNMLSNRLRELLGLSEFPQAKYSPVIGAALLAKLALH